MTMRNDGVVDDVLDSIFLECGSDDTCMGYKCLVSFHRTQITRSRTDREYRQVRKVRQNSADLEPNSSMEDMGQQFKVCKTDPMVWVLGSRQMSVRSLTFP